MDKERIYQDQDEYIEEVLLCNYPHLSIQDIQEMDIDEKRMLIGWD
jgi:hypothetical protein|tara:strand:+ start:186 stop:323 length:138 start_codon:yes stop_codon:yes gene_type:complete